VVLTLSEAVLAVLSV